MSVATSTDELRALLPREEWSHKLTKKSVEEFLETVLYVDGHLAHMAYAEIQVQLSDGEFVAFLHLVGTDQEKFLKFGRRYCAGDIDAKFCADGDGYCDPSYCH